jgi:hypothetical protein
VNTWNGEEILGSPGQRLLESLGAVRGYRTMDWMTKQRGSE